MKGESEVAQSSPTLCDPMDCSLPGSSIHGIFQARVLEWGAIAFSGIELHIARIQEIFFPTISCKLRYLMLQNAFQDPGDTVNFLVTKEMALHHEGMSGSFHGWLLEAEPPTFMF